MAPAETSVRQIGYMYVPPDGWTKAFDTWSCPVSFEYRYISRERRSIPIGDEVVEKTCHYPRTMYDSKTQPR